MKNPIKQVREILNITQPEPNKIYALTGGSDDKAISNGNNWKECEVKTSDEQTA